MNIVRTIVLIAFGAFLFVGAPAAKAGPGLSLSESVKEGLIGLKPVRGSAVTSDVFDGKPLLVVFFASW
ncbi:MAG: hypothetical protein QGH73_12295 [Rhodospirillales bacterium]|nr:hypothetical protein [Rhodospirillales bacterium]MDP6643000.1 hypothetical protein [Rhodospirillales bacterium]MDP6842449.1 hypothetical protein [Rhodospirillales bacterium]